MADRCGVLTCKLKGLGMGQTLRSMFKFFWLIGTTSSERQNASQHFCSCDLAETGGSPAASGSPTAKGLLPGATSARGATPFRQAQQPPCGRFLEGEDKPRSYKYYYSTLPVKFLLKKQEN